MAAKGEKLELDAGGRTVAISSPGKVMFPEHGETKADLARYYLAVAEPLMRTVRDRPTLLQRFPDGATGKSFFQKRIPESAPDWLQTTTVSTPNGTTSRAIVMADIAHVLWAANQGCLGFHPWPYRAATPDETDELRLDLDPSPGVTFEMVPRGGGGRARVPRRARHRPPSRRPRATAACTCTCAWRRDGTRSRCARPPCRWPARWSAAGPT